MMFSRKKQEIINPYTVEQCALCNAVKKKKFAEDDYVFKTIGKCSSCNNGTVLISKIYGESVK
ncbi:MAG: hypothetical protein KGH89_04410 [Thaumarchaeota archaeon]|nr:hypothetical protein [Nitrososphaerota archaeon]